MRRQTATLALIAGGALLGAGTARAQFGRGAGEWNTAGADAHRSSWVRTDPKISAAALAKPGFAYLWKLKLDNAPRQQNGLSPALVMSGYIGYRGFRTLGFVGGASDKSFGVDVDLGRLEWQKPLPGGAAAAGTAACPGGLTSNVARVLATAFPQTGGQQGGGRGRGGSAKSAVGEPGEGAVLLKEMAAAAAARAGANAPDGGRGGRGGRGPGGAPGERPRRMPNYLHVLGADGMLHSQYVSNGHEQDAAVKFIGPNANAHGLIIADGMAYVATTGNCGNVTDGVWGLNMDSKAVTSWAGKVAGSIGPALGPDGTVYVSTTNGDLVALEGKTLKVKEVYQAKSELTTSPVIFQYKDKTLAAAAAKDGTIHVVDVAKMSAPFAAPAAAGANGAGIASWQDADGMRWLLVPTATSVGAWKLVEQNGAASLQKGWTKDIASPVAPIVINNVVFAATAGARNTPTVLYALDGATGKEFWNSGKSILGFLPRNGGLSGGGTQIYLGTHDGTLYAFGFPMEH
jgi:outer membrane protein assembly factor BamB